jgi:hypothetical protein
VIRPNSDYWSKPQPPTKSNSAPKHSSPNKDFPKNPKEVADENCSNSSSKPNSSKWITNNLLKPVKLQISPEKSKKAEIQKNIKVEIEKIRQAETERAQIALGKKNIYRKKTEIGASESLGPKIAEKKEKFDGKTEVQVDRKNIYPNRNKTIEPPKAVAVEDKDRLLAQKKNVYNRESQSKGESLKSVSVQSKASEKEIKLQARQAERDRLAAERRNIYNKPKGGCGQSCQDDEPAKKVTPTQELRAQDRKNIYSKRHQSEDFRVEASPAKEISTKSPQVHNKLNISNKNYGKKVDEPKFGKLDSNAQSKLTSPRGEKQDLDLKKETYVYKTPVNSSKNGNNRSSQDKLEKTIVRSGTPIREVDSESPMSAEEQKKLAIWKKSYGSKLEKQSPGDLSSVNYNSTPSRPQDPMETKSEVGSYKKFDYNTNNVKFQTPNESKTDRIPPRAMKKDIKTQKSQDNLAKVTKTDRTHEDTNDKSIFQRNHELVMRTLKGVNAQMLPKNLSAFPNHPSNKLLKKTETTQSESFSCKQENLSKRSALSPSRFDN